MAPTLLRGQGPSTCRPAGSRADTARAILDGLTTAASLPAGLSGPARDWVGREHGLIIGAERPAAADGRMLDTLDPATGRVVASVPHAGPADVDRAVQAAREAFAGGAPWRRLPAPARAQALHRLAELIEAHAEELAQLESLDNGKPVQAAAGDVAGTVTHLRYYAGWPTKIEGGVVPTGHGDKMLAYTLREPVGVCGQIVPWNYPLLMAAWKIGPALAAGCTVVLKPAEQTPLTALRLGELALEAGLPEGVLNVVTGDGETGAALVDHPGVDKVAFTGSTSVGREIGAKCGAALKRVTLELGGKSPNIILPDADLAAALPHSFNGLFFNAGQACNAASRLFVPRERHEEVLAALAQRAASTRLGPGLDPETQLGPVVSAEQLERVLGYVEAGRGEGAELITGGGRAGDEGYFVEPTLFSTEDDDARIAREEIFGPVLVALPYDTLEEVAARANDTEYGLAAGVWTRDVSNAHRLAGLLKAGSVYVNNWRGGDPALPFGGFKGSGVGREHGREGLEAYLETKSVSVAL